MSSKIYIVRQDALGSVVFVLGGILFCVFPWFTNDDGGFFVIAFFVLIGAMAVCAGIVGWVCFRVGLVADRHGIWCSGRSLSQKSHVPWDSMLGTRKLKWTSHEGEHEGVVIGLKENTPHPLGSKVVALIIKSELEKLVGEIEYANPLFLAHDEWDWQPDDFVTLASTCIRDANARKELGEYKWVPIDQSTQHDTAF